MVPPAGSAEKDGESKQQTVDERARSSTRSSRNKEIGGGEGHRRAAGRRSVRSTPPPRLAAIRELRARRRRPAAKNTLARTAAADMRAGGRGWRGAVMPPPEKRKRRSSAALRRRSPPRRRLESATGSSAPARGETARRLKAEISGTTLRARRAPQGGRQRAKEVKSNQELTGLARQGAGPPTRLRGRPPQNKSIDADDHGARRARASTQQENLYNREFQIQRPRLATSARWAAMRTRSFAGMGAKSSRRARRHRSTKAARAEFDKRPRRSGEQRTRRRTPAANNER